MSLRATAPVIVTHMYPAQGDEIVLVLYEEEFLFVLRVTIVRAATLLGHDDVGHGERVPGLEQRKQQHAHTSVHTHKKSFTHCYDPRSKDSRLNKMNRVVCHWFATGKKKKKKTQNTQSCS